MKSCKAKAGTGGEEEEEEMAEAAPPKPKKSAATKREKPSTGMSQTQRPTTAKVKPTGGLVGRAIKKKVTADDESSKTLSIKDVGRKDRRNVVDAKSKWTVDEIREDYVKKLEDHMESALGSVMTKKLFSKNFKTHVECINLFKTAFEDEEIQSQFVEITDLIIKWAFIKCVESSNTTFLKEILIFIE